MIKIIIIIIIIIIMIIIITIYRINNNNNFTFKYSENTALYFVPQFGGKKVLEEEGGGSLVSEAKQRECGRRYHEVQYVYLC